MIKILLQKWKLFCPDIKISFNLKLLDQNFDNRCLLRFLDSSAHWRQITIYSGPWPLGEHDVKKRSHDCPMALSFIIVINFAFKTCLLSFVVISDADKLLVSNPARWTLSSYWDLCIHHLYISNIQRTEKYSAVMYW